MTNKKQEREERRVNIRTHLQVIVCSESVIVNLISDVPHPRGVAHLSLSKGRDYVVEKEGGITAHYTDASGRGYDISIVRTERGSQ